MNINFGSWTKEKIDEILAEASGIANQGERIMFVSGLFIGAPYKAGTLGGGNVKAEELIIDLEGVDSFTYLDYVEAMRISDAFSEFIGNLGRVRYRGGEISFRQRNHFFTDWREYNAGLVRDITKEIGGRTAEKTVKHLNRRDDGTFILDGLEPVWRDIVYIPAGNIDTFLRGELRTGDYIGIYSNAAGLDVSHVGIIIKSDDIFLRHASSDKGKVVDESFSEYIAGKPGIIVLRAVAGQGK
ncbi:MAG: DUF1460 domain-containing protein [Nitrospirae bacterium]|nr:DUF1460 domain-containing protein [Nitrospirota bacterium]